MSALKEAKSPLLVDPELFRFVSDDNGSSEKFRGRIVKSLDKLFEGGGFLPPPEEGDGGGGGGGDGEKFEFLDADSYCEYLDCFANAAVVRAVTDRDESDKEGRISAEKYIECIEKEQKRTHRMQEDRRRALMENMLSDEECTIPECAFIAMRNEEDKKKVTALFSLQQQKSSNWRNWLIRFTAGDPSGIGPRLPESKDPRWPESKDPWEERYKLLAFLANNQMRLYVERRYNRRDFWTEDWFDKSDGFDI